MRITRLSLRTSFAVVAVAILALAFASFAFGATPTVIGADGASVWTYSDLADAAAKYEGGYAAFGEGLTGSDGLADDYENPHGGYDTATNKCKVCHAVHRAEGAYYLLRADSQDDACDYCHIGASAHSSKVVYDLNSAGKGTTNGHTIGASTYIPDSTVAQWTESVTLETADENGDPLTETIQVRAYDEQKNDMFRFARHHGHSEATGGARRNYVPVGPLALRCMNCHQVHNASAQTWQPISMDSMDNTGRHTATTKDSYKLLKQFPSGTFVGGPDSYGQIPLGNISLVPEDALVAGVTFDATRAQGADPSPLNLMRGSTPRAYNKPMWVAQNIDHVGYAAPDERSNPSAVNAAALSVWCADCHNLNLGGAKILANPELGFKAHTERTHPAPYVGAFRGPGQCYSCHRSDLPPVNTGDPCSQCHYGTGNYRENRFDVSGAEYIASDFPHSGEDGDYKMLGSYSVDVANLAPTTIDPDVAVGANNLDAVCLRCHWPEQKYHEGDGGGSTDVHDVPAAYADCTTCHTAGNAADIHTAAPAGCGSCHEADTLTTDCATCHPEKLEPHGALPELHTVGSTCAVSGCHDPNVVLIHAVPGCDACHGVGVTPSLVCSNCHTGNLHPTADHTSSVTCDACHSISNLMTIHGDDCGTCHPTPTSSMGAWNQTCEQSGCHAQPFHPDQTFWGHDYHNEGENCWPCHDGDPSLSTCVDCHAHIYDRVNPTTTSNAAASYQGTAVITLTPYDPPSVDNVPPGGWGVNRTYYQVDGGPLQIGTTITIAPPASGIKSHTIEFWSLDNMRNTEEPHKKATFTVSPPVPDTTPPVTTSNAAASYTGPAIITLLATDAGGSGVATTYYRLDGGAQTAGTSVSVPAPATGTASHTLEFWSVDGASNIEMPHNSASFTVAAVPADTTPPVTTSNAAASYTGPASITLSATDVGGSGVATTYYRLDGGAQTAGTSVSVPAPASGTVSHTLEFWSVDGASNIELPHKSASFTVSAPVAATGTITLMWNAPDGSWAEYWIYDGLGQVVAHATADTIPGWYGWYTATVPVSPVAYTWYTEWYDPEWEMWGADDPWGSTSGSALINTPGAAYSSWY